MEEVFKNWLISRGYSPTGAANSYSRAIPLISEHYSTSNHTSVNIYEIADQATISSIAHDYSQGGRFSDFGYGQHGRFRAAISRYSEFFVHHNGEPFDLPCDDEPVEPDVTDSCNNFAYERDLQTAICAQISDFFPGYKIFGDSNLGIEYSIAGRRIDVLLENIETRNLLVIELKSGRADFKVFGQISMYLGLMDQQFQDRDIEGVIVAGEIDESLTVACETSSRISTKIYRMMIELEDA